jgi:hypothetical protein
MESSLSSNQNNLIERMSQYSLQRADIDLVKDNHLTDMEKIVAGHPGNKAIHAKNSLMISYRCK